MAQLAVWTLWVSLVLPVVGLSIPADAQDILSVDGADLFASVEYIGGDATHPKKGWGVMVLTDSTVALYNCKDPSCPRRRGRIELTAAPWMSINLRTLREVSSASVVRGPSAGSRIAWGLLAGDRKEEMVGLVYETESSAEAPVFKTPEAMAAAIEAKIRFRLRKLGVDLPR